MNRRFTPHERRAPQRQRRRPGAIMRWLLCGALVIGIVTPTLVGADRATDQQQALQQLLARLGLVDLQIFQLEQQLKDAAPDARSLQAASKLADLYAARLLASADDPKQYADLMARINKLLQRFPKANTTALQVMVLQADYNQAETRIADWIADPQQAEAKAEAARILIRIAPLLDKYQQTLNQQLEQLAAQMDSAPEGDALRALEQQTRRVQNVTARATYFAAWANYYLAMIRGDKANSPTYQRAREVFRKLLGIGDQTMTAVKAEWLGLESIWKARALIGLGLSEAACGHAEASEKCFALLENAAVPMPIRDQAPYWHLRALLGAGRWQPAVTFAQRLVRGFTKDATQGDVSFCVALVRAGYGPAPELASADAAYRAELGKLGLVGLARLGQLNAVDTLLEKYKIPVDDRAGFILLWARGQKQFAKAEQTKETSDYAGAAKLLQAALNSRDAGVLPGPAARCRYTLAWCLYRQDKLRAAAEQFTRAVGALHEAKEALAPEAAWMAFVAYRQLAKQRPEMLSKATAALNRIKQDFPNHAYAKRADLEMARLLVGTSPDKTVRFLEAVKPNEPNYVEARYELCLLWHQRWSQSKRDPETARAQRQALVQAVETFLKAAGTGTKPQRLAKACLLVVDAAGQAPNPDPNLVATYLARAARYARQLKDDDPLAAEYHYRALQQAARNGASDMRRQHAQWLIDHAAGTPYEQAALIVIAGELDKAVRAKQPADTKTIQQAYAAFRRLVNVLGAAPDKLASAKNSRVAVSRLASYAARLGHYDEAAQWLEKLLVVFPRDRGYLQRAGLAAFHARQYDRSLAHWRTLLAGLPRGSQAWLEAKYYQLRCLAKTDKPKARRVFHQFQLLYPDLGGSQWKSKFQQVVTDK